MSDFESISSYLSTPKTKKQKRKHKVQKFNIGSSKEYDDWNWYCIHIKKKIVCLKISVLDFLVQVKIVKKKKGKYRISWTFMVFC